MDCSTPGLPVHHHLLELAQIHVRQVYDAIHRLILCYPLFLPPSIFPSIRVFANESVLHFRWHKYWIFSFSISPSNEYSGLISFRMNWLDLLAVQGTLKRLLQHLSSKASFLWYSPFFMVQISHPYMTTAKTIALTIRIFVGKVMVIVVLIMVVVIWWYGSNYHTIALISHTSKVMLKILQTRLQQYMNHELPDVQAGFRKGRGTRDQIANIHWIIEKAREFQKNIYFCFVWLC